MFSWFIFDGGKLIGVLFHGENYCSHSQPLLIPCRLMCKVRALLSLLGSFVHAYYHFPCLLHVYRIILVRLTGTASDILADAVSEKTLILCPLQY